ncbi:MAG TPA: hypothetical protein VHA54_11580 [Solirubrobacterales bacterium]|nr:hypothetical protein [Solirubrobacterales bacterium]
MTRLATLLPTAAQTPPPAGGAELGQIVIATVAAAALTAALLYFGFGHRSGRVRALGRLARFSERLSGLPGWAALPSTIAAISLITALFGMYWDISLHIDNGRDPGPLANPAHYFILAGLFGIFTAGFVAMVLPEGRPSRVAIRLGPDWWAPLGGVLICACAGFSLIGFPLDDVWHRIFGQDVTLWGPTHLMLIGGAAMTLIGIAVLTVEGLRANAGRERPRRELASTRAMRAVFLTGGLMVGLSTFQAEFDFGVPQFQLVFQPMLLMLAAGMGLVLARIYGGRGAALGAALFFVVVRGGLALLVGPVLGQTTPHLPLYLVEALVVEAVALRVSSDEPLRFGLWAGAGIGTVGLAAEWAWSHLWMPLPWPGALFPEGAIVGFLAAMAGAMLGAWAGTHLSIDPGVRRPRLREAAVASALTLTALVLFGLYTPADRGVSATVALRTLPGGDGRHVEARIALDPPGAAAGAEWFDVTAWQGGGLVVDPLERTGPGRYRTTEPIPVYGNWKTMVRLHKGHSLTALPIYLPRDAAIPVGEVPAPARFDRPFGNEHKLLQREQKGGSPLLVAVAYSTVAGISLGLLALLAWALHRLSFGPAPARRRGRQAARGGLGLEGGGGA